MGTLDELLRTLYPPKHKVFVSYHHANDQWDRERFEKLFSEYYDIFISKVFKLETLIQI